VVRSGCLNRGKRPFYNRSDRRTALESMENLGIASLAERCYRELSGGEQQRTLLARALCSVAASSTGKNKILLLDEPASGLDPNAAAEMYELICRLNADGITIIMISHDIGASLKYASHILHLGRHNMLFFGKKSDYLIQQTR
jgi:zinc transport system ATP-binding protein